MGDKNFRLSNDVRPDRYRFRIRPDLAAARFDAEGSIHLTLHAPVRSITLHGSHLAVTRAHAATSSVGPTAAAVAEATSATATVTADEESQTLTLDFDRQLPQGAATLDLAWSGILHGDLRGFYLAGGIGVTQFEAADARRVFPCFDEPPFKATWELAVELPDARGAAPLAVIGNGAIASDVHEGGRRVVTFLPTPRISSYLVALVVGKLVATDEVVVRGVPLRTWAQPAKAHLGGFAQECAAAVLPLLADYFAVPYAFGKVDQVGVPDFEAGAMENVGCITFREIALLVDPEHASLAQRKRVAEIITHELAHQWFGNLVTMEWWDDLWLNEAFATWMAYKIVDAWRPGWRMWDDFASGKAAALAMDAMESTHPIRAEVLNADQATENFDLITYEKGGAMLRMIEGYLGADAFRAGIRDYMRDYAYRNAVADDLWRALGRMTGQPIDAVANAWIGRPGFPLVDVVRDGARLLLAQRRFHSDPARFQASAEAPWPVPMVVRFEDDAGVHEARRLLDSPGGEMTLPATGEVRWVMANSGGAGFYRVKYEPEEILNLARHAGALSAVERTGLVADAVAVFRAGGGALGPWLDLLVAFAADEDYTVTAEVVGSLDMVERRFAGEADRPRVRALVERLLAPRLAALGIATAAGESDDVRLGRAAVVRGMALVARAPAVVAELGGRLDRVWAGEGAALDPNLLDAATVAAARAADGARFDRLVERATTLADPAEKRRALVGLASVESEALVGRAIELTFSDVVPMQDVTIFTGSLLANRAARDATWEMLRGRWAEVRKKLSPSLIRRMVEGLRELSHRTEEVEAFFVAEAASFATIPQALSQTRERLRLDADARRRAEPELAAWLARRSA